MTHPVYQSQGKDDATRVDEIKMYPVIIQSVQFLVVSWNIFMVIKKPTRMLHVVLFNLGLEDFSDSSH